LLIGSDVIKLAPKVNNLGYVLNERLTATGHFKKVYWILRSLRPYALHTPFEVRRRLVVALIMPHIGYGGIVYAGADAASQRMDQKASATIHTKKFKRPCMGDCKGPCGQCCIASMASPPLRTRILVVQAHRSLAMSQSFVVLGRRAWNALPHDMKILPTRASFVSSVRRMVRGVDASNSVIYLFLRTYFVSVAPTTLLKVQIVC
jgi:hypothetical protein